MTASFLTTATDAYLLPKVAIVQEDRFKAAAIKRKERVKGSHRLEANNEARKLCKRLKGIIDVTLKKQQYSKLSSSVGKQLKELRMGRQGVESQIKVWLLAINQS